MKLRSIALENVRRFTAPARIDAIADGLNVLCEPNEHGKSTLFDAVQALFFVPHASQAREVKSLRPRAGGAPEVTIEVETEAGRFSIAKRWLSKPYARVTQAGRVVAQADAAEAWIAELLGGGDGGPAGLVWVRQGLTGLGGGSKKEQDAALEARRDLMSSVGHEIEAMTGGRRMDQALAACRAELGAYATGTGRPRSGGPWKAALDRVAELSEQRAALAATATALHDALATRRRARRALAEVEDPDAASARKRRLDAATAAHEAALRHADAVEAEARKVEAAQLALASARTRLETLRTALAERAAARTSRAAAEAEARGAAAERAAAGAAFETTQATLETAQADLTAARDRLRQAQRRQAARDGAAGRARLAEQIDRAEAARKAMEEAAAAARHGPDAATLRDLEALASARAAARAARDATATQVVVTYAPGLAETVRLDGHPLEGGRPVAIPRTARLAIDGVGEIEVRPAATGRDDASVETAERALRAALDAAGMADLDDARAAADARAEAARRVGEAKAVLGNVAPRGLDPLRQALVAIPEPGEEAPDAPDPTDAEAAVTTAESAQVAAQVARDAAAERLSEARSAAARAEAAALAARERLQRAEAAIERLGDGTEGALEEQFQRASAALQAAEALREEKARAAPDLVASEAALTRARAVDDEAHAEIARLKPEIARLDERIARSSGDAVEERLAETDQEHAAAEAERDRIEHEVAVLRRLEAALEEAKAQARDRYFAPVAAELRPLLHFLWPDADLTWGQETLLPDALIRDGAEEPIEILSGGTQEQVALLVRLAFARMLARSGRHAPVILDDAMVFTDDDRIERMFDALHRQAGDLQILVLSCRQRAFRDLGGRALRLREPDAGEDAA